MKSRNDNQKKFLGSSLAFLLVAQLVSVGCGGSSSTTNDTIQKPASDKADGTLIDKLCLQIGLPEGCDICEAQGWYNDGECDEFCQKPDFSDCYMGNHCAWETVWPVASTTEEMDKNIKGIPEEIWDESQLSRMELHQIFMIFWKFGYVSEEDDFYRPFTIPDDKIVKTKGKTTTNVGYDIYTFVYADVWMGGVFKQDTLTLVALFEDGDILGCFAGEDDENPDGTVVRCSSDTNWDCIIGEAIEPIDGPNELAKKIIIEDILRTSLRETLLAGKKSMEEYKHVGMEEEYEVTFHGAYEIYRSERDHTVVAYALWGTGYGPQEFEEGLVYGYDADGFFVYSNSEIFY